ncbi:MAG: DUF4013 domain-containing protein [Anaerolineae bacterium]|nr:DUF4013 domain-containing protein [Anaerolineae bacterium]
MGFDLGQAFTFAFDDSKWRPRLFFLLLLSFIPGMNLIAWSGYSLSTARAIAMQEESKLPLWEDWSDILVRGLLSIVATLLYFLPAIVISGCFWIMELALGDRAQGSFIAVRFCANGIAIVYMLITSLLLNAAHARFAQTDQFNFSYLNLASRITDLRQHTSRLLTLTVFQWIVMALIIGVLFVGVVLFIVAINFMVRLGIVVTILLIPVLLLLLLLVAAVVSLAYLALGYALGAFAVQLPVNLPANKDRDAGAGTEMTTGGIRTNPKRAPAR